MQDVRVRLLKSYKPVGMLASEDGRFLYCLMTYGVVILDAATLEKRQTIRLKDPRMALSPDGRLLCCVRPVGSTGEVIEVILYTVGDVHETLYRTKIKGAIHDIAPCFSADGNTLLVCTRGEQERVWALDTVSGRERLLYECDADHIFSAIDGGESGFLISLFNRKPDVPFDAILAYQSVEDAPKIISFEVGAEQEDMLDHGKLSVTAKWIDAKRILLVYSASGYRMLLQVLDEKPMAPIVPEARYTIPYMLYGSPVLSCDGQHLASRGVAYDEKSRRMRNFASVVRAEDGETVWQEEQRYIWDVQFGVDRNTVLLCGGTPKIVLLS